MEEELRKDAFDIVREPETSPISQEQLVAEVKGIYVGLVMVEAKCIEVDNKQTALAGQGDSAPLPKLNNGQWQALITLHRMLLHERHDFFLASRHPSASPADWHQNMQCQRGCGTMAYIHSSNYCGIVWHRLTTC